MKNPIKRISGALSLACWLGMFLFTETSLWFGLLLIPAAVFMYLAGGCFECFYPKRKSRREVRTLKRQ